MKVAFLITTLLFLSSTSQAQVRRQVANERIRTDVMVTDRTRVSRQQLADTIPGRAKNFYKIDQSRYLRYVATNLNDSVKMQKAAAKDWDDFASAVSKLQATLKTNPFNNVADYVDQNNDFRSLQLVERSTSPNTAKICLRQLIFNVNLANTLLTNRMAAQLEPKLLSSVIRNIDTISLAYIVPFVTLRTMSRMTYPKILFQVVDKNDSEVTNVSCILITPKVCRDIGCKTCKVSPEPCVEQTVTNIISLSDYSYDCRNPKVLDVAPGVYHLFVVNENKIVDYQWRSFDANDILPGDQPKPVKIVLR